MTREEKLMKVHALLAEVSDVLVSEGALPTDE